MGDHYISDAEDWSDAWFWDVTAYAFSKLLRNSPFNPMSWKRTWGWYVMGEGERPNKYDLGAHIVWSSPAWIAAAMFPGQTFGFIKSTVAITTSIGRGASVNTLGAPILFLGVLNSARQLPMFQTSGLSSV